LIKDEQNKNRKIQSGQGNFCTQNTQLIITKKEDKFLFFLFFKKINMVENVKKFL
jgi:hypothetical protein